MSTKRNNYIQKDKFYMKLAINLAKKRIGLTGTNPSVGCVIVKNDTVISTGQTGLKGYPHAEVDAINNCKENISGSSIYVSLEPCSHYGKTPPCTNAIIKAKIKRVFYGMDDIDIRSASKSYDLFKKKKIQVIRNILKNDAFDLYRSYKHNKIHAYPYIVGKIACSRDYYITTKKRKITNDHSHQVSHILRYHNNGILISSKTANHDNPKLNCRISGLENYSPTVIIVDKNLSIKVNLKLFNNQKKIYIFYNKDNIKKYKILRKLGVNLIKVGLKNNRMDIDKILKKIKERQINHLLVEGGKMLTDYFVNNNFFNEFYLFKSSLNLKKLGQNNILATINKLGKYFKNKQKISTYLSNDELIHYK